MFSLSLCSEIDYRGRISYFRFSERTFTRAVGLNGPPCFSDLSVGHTHIALVIIAYEDWWSRADFVLLIHRNMIARGRGAKWTVWKNFTRAYVMMKDNEIVFAIIITVSWNQLLRAVIVLDILRTKITWLVHFAPVFSVPKIGARNSIEHWHHFFHGSSRLARVNERTHVVKDARRYVTKKKEEKCHSRIIDKFACDAPVSCLAS